MTYLRGIRAFIRPLSAAEKLSSAPFVSPGVYLSAPARYWLAKPCYSKQDTLVTDRQNH